MNIVKLQNQLKSVPTEVLIKYVQGMNPEVPSYLALAEIKSRKEMEERYAAQNQAAPSSSVAEDLTQAPQQIDQSGGLAMLARNPTPQGAPTSQGVADLPTGDMYDEKNFATGGIVAFEEGGKVPRFAGLGGSYINPEMAYNDPTLMAQYQEYLKANPIYVRNPQAGFKAFLNDLSKTGEVMRTTLSPSFLSQVGLAGYESGKGATADIAQKAKERYFGGSPTISGAPTTVPGAEVLGSTASAERLTNPMYATDYARAVESVGKKSSAPVSTPQEDVTKPMPGPASEPKQAGIDSLLEDTTGLAEKKAARYEQMMGVNPERARLEELVKKYETGAGEQERMAPWMALAKAGFTMAGGKSPYAIQNLSEGAVAGLADYAQAKDKLDKLTERQIDLRSKLLQVDDARKSAAVTYGVNSEEHAATRNAQVKLKKLEEENAFARTKYAADVSTKNAMIAAAKKSDYETFIDLAKQDEDNYKTIKDKDGTVRKVFDANKATQVYKSFSGSTGLHDDKLFEAWNLEKMKDKNFNLSFEEYKDKIRGAAGAASSASSSSWGPLKVK